MTDRKTLTARAVIIAALQKQLEAEYQRTKAELGALFADAGEREVGSLDDERIGTATLEPGKETWSVVDEQAFLNWVIAAYRHETVLAVQPAFTAAILSKCKRDGGIVDWETGAVELPPGVAMRKSPPNLVVRTDKNASQRVRDWLGAATAQQLGIGSGNG